MTHSTRALALLLSTSLLGCESREPAAMPPASDRIAAAAEKAAPQAETAVDDSPSLGIAERDLSRIEEALKIKLPAEYRQFIAARGNELTQRTYPLLGETRTWLELEFFLDVDRLISENLQQREPDWAAAEAFPRWWREYFLLGTNGGGDYYAIKLDGSPGVWFMACDAGTIRLYAQSLEDYLAKSLADFPAELEEYKQLEAVWQQKARGEIDEAEFDKKWQAILDAEN